MSDMFCCRLRELRRKNGYTQSSLAKALGVSQSTIGNWEAGIRLPNLDTLERITRLFGISVGWFFGEQEAKAELEKAKRERLNREKGCEYCLDDNCPPLDWKYGLDHIFPDYGFCPMCGRKLKGEDND